VSRKLSTIDGAWSLKPAPTGKFPTRSGVLFKPHDVRSGLAERAMHACCAAEPYSSVAWRLPLQRFQRE